MASRTFRLTAAALLLFGSALPARATLMQLDFQATVTGVPTVLSSAFTNGDAATGTIFFDDATPDNFPADLTFGSYAGAVSGASYQFGSYAATGSSGSVLIGDASVDTWEATVGTVSGAAVGIYTLDGLNVKLQDDTGAALSDDLLTNPLVLGDWGLKFANIVFSDGQGGFASVNATLSSLTVVPVPEPSVALLLLVAAGLQAAERLAGRRTRRA